MGQGKRKRRGSRQRVDLRDVMMTLFLSDASQEEIMGMTPRERRAAQQEGRRVREAPGYRSWSAESMGMWRAWQDSKAPDKIWDWKRHLEAQGRLDLYRDISREDGFVCGKCGEFTAVPYCLPDERLWLCKACTAGRPAQAGHFRPRRGA
jgi:hypothetical protein